MKNKTKNKNKKKDKKSIKELKTVLPYFKPYKVKIVLASIAIFLADASFILTGYLNGLALEEALKLHVKSAIIALLIYLLVEIITGPICTIVEKLLSKVQWKIARQIGYDTFVKTMQLPAEAFEQMESGKIINRVTKDSETLVYNAQRLISIASRLITTFIILIYIFINSYIVGIEVLVISVVFAVMTFTYNGIFKKKHDAIKNAEDKFVSITNESVRGLRESRSLGILNNLRKIVNKDIDVLEEKKIDEINVYLSNNIISDILFFIIEALTFAICAILLYDGKITITFMVAMTYYVYRFTGVFSQVQSFMKMYSQTIVAVARINDVLCDRLYKSVEYGDTVLKNTKGVVEFKNVTFGYPNEKNILNNFNIKFDENKKIAIVGASGEGKSTLFNLITRIFDVKDGTIMLDGINIRDLTEESLRNNISIIRQEPFLFNKTIYENFKMLDENVSLRNVKKYCKIAGIDDYISSLPKGYDTILGEGGVNLSGGQKQRIAIARSLMKNTKVILFDEATSALDNESQEHIKDAIDELKKNHTIIIVAHRLSTIMDADTIYVVNKGKVVDSGTHEELMKTCSYYKKLYTSDKNTILEG